MRGNDTVEVYSVLAGKLVYITKYEIESGKAYEMRQVSLPWKPGKEAIVLYMPKDKVRDDVGNVDSW